MMDQEIPNYWPGQCFCCSSANSHSLGLRFYLSDNGCYTRYSIPDYLCGIDGMAHGGIIALLLDEVSQWATIAQLGKIGLTREISIRYVKPVPTNTEIRVVAKIETRHDKDAILRATIHSKDNELLAEGEINWVMTNPSNVAKISKVDESRLKEFLAHYPVERSA